MTALHSSLAMESLMQAMETMAFMTPTPADPALCPSADSVQVIMPFTGPLCGTVEMVVAEAVGLELAANMLATTLDDPAAKCFAKDALKELLNVTCGLLLPTLVPQESATTPFRMTLPQLTSFDGQHQWTEFAASPDICVLDVEGRLIALRVKCG